LKDPALKSAGFLLQVDTSFSDFRLRAVVKHGLNAICHDKIRACRPAGAAIQVEN
jgi:hypothetical protein